MQIIQVRTCLPSIMALLPTIDAFELMWEAGQLDGDVEHHLNEDQQLALSLRTRFATGHAGDISLIILER